MRATGQLLLEISGRGTQKLACKALNASKSSTDGQGEAGLLCEILIFKLSNGSLTVILIIFIIHMRIIMT